MQLTLERARELLRYDPDTGVLTWIAKPAPESKIKIGQTFGSYQNDGYLQGRVGEKKYLAHRLAWLLFYGKWPTQIIDHLNGVRDDNRIANLRDVTYRVNVENQRRASSNNKSSDLLGANFIKESNKWRAQITVRGKCIVSGRFATAEEAHLAYLELKRQFHDGCTI